MITGGISDKLGNEFEQLWLANLMLDVIADKAISISIEPRDTVVRKAECVVIRPDGTKEAHQCKRGNASDGEWTVGNLVSAGIIQAADDWFAKSDTHRFVFVSGDPVPGLRDLSDRARQLTDLQAFWDESATNDVLKRGRAKLIQALSLDESILKDPPHRRIRTITSSPLPSPDVHPSVDTWSTECGRLHCFLRNFVVSLEDYNRLRERVEDRAATLILRRAPDAVRHLELLAQSEFRKPLDATWLIASLR